VPDQRSASDPHPAGPPDVDSAWAEVLAARALGRPTGIHVAAAATSSWIELGAGTDPALRTALTTLDGRRVVVVACDRYAGGGRPGPAGYRVAQRGIALAGRLGVPVVTLVDTPGAEPGPDAENDAIAAEIARTFAAMARVPVPTISVCVGEGGSGGALALAGTDRFLVQEHAVFSVIGPEGAAAILERDADRAPEVAARLKLTSADLLELGIVDAVVPDDLGATVDALGRALAAARDDAANSAAGAGGGRGRRTRFDAATAAWLFGDRPDPPS
jgi:acetyl-CoA carboxylase carboxyl transferase subunit beta